MKTLAPVMLLLCLALSGCDNASDETRSRHPLDRDNERQAVVEERTAVVQPEEERPARKDRPIAREERSVMLQFFVSWGWWLAYYVVGAFVGVIVYRDAKRRTRLAMNIRPIWWFLITVFDAPLGLLVYWILNYSNLAAEQSRSDEGVR